jgi:hypothetical protein
MWEAYKGDICQYIAKTQGLGNYRLPMGIEFGENADWTWVNGGNNYAGGSYGGTISVTNGRYFKNNTNLFFPSAGRRGGPDGTLYLASSPDATDLYGRYWSGSTRNANTSYYLCFLSNIVWTNEYIGKYYAQTIRCILQE